MRSIYHPPQVDIIAAGYIIRDSKERISLKKGSNLTIRAFFHGASDET